MKTRLAVTSLFAALTTAAFAEQTSRHGMVMSRGAHVMPFDQGVAMHMFTPNASGGTIEVMVHNMDAKQIALVRAHLRKEAARFSLGDYSDPFYIHGAAMPGLRGMETHTVAVRYSTTAMGAKITFVATDPAAIRSVHAWLSAQAADHGVTSRPASAAPIRRYRSVRLRAF
jgi:hypothetical protein